MRDPERSSGDAVPDSLVGRTGLPAGCWSQTQKGWWRGRLIVRWLAAMLGIVLLGASGRVGAQPESSEGPVHLMRVTGTIDLGLAPYVARSIERAEQDEAVAIVVLIDTPGGRVDAVLQMRDALLDTPVRTIALVDASAFSAGALVAIASDEIYMTPGAALGAATPVIGGTGEVADEKTISAVKAVFESTAAANARDPRIAAAMVDTRVVVPGLVSGEELLTLTASEAIDAGYAEGEVSGLDGLLAELGFDDNELVVDHLSLAERAVRVLTHPVVAGLLLMGGFLLIIGDLFSGGLGFPALGGVLLLGAFFWGHSLAGLSGWEDLALVLIGLALLAAEVFVIPGFGVAGILGLAALGAGAFLAMVYRDFDFVTTEALWRAGLTVAVSLLFAVFGVVALVGFAARRGVSSGLVLTSGSDGRPAATKRSAHPWLGWFGAQDRLEPDRVAPPAPRDGGADRSLVGTTGISVSDLRPGGIAELDGRRVDVVTSGEYVAAGTDIEVIQDDRYRRVVRRRR